jgi:hypothetical protein
MKNNKNVENILVDLTDLEKLANSEKEKSKPTMLDRAKAAWQNIKSNIDMEPAMSEPLGFTNSPEADVERERLSVTAKQPNFDYMNNRWYDYANRLNEGKLTPKESLQRKLKKQRYKVSYIQDGKKVEVFASSIRGVRRVVYGKKQYRVHNSTGSDVTGYFKKLLGE